MAQSASKNGRPGRRNARYALGLWCGAIGLVWLIVLPWWAKRTTMQAHLEWLQARRVDPSAMYYTELEAMKPILQDINARERGSRADERR
jgi:hypothetical protein